MPATVVQYRCMSYPLKDLFTQQSVHTGYVFLELEIMAELVLK